MRIPIARLALTALLALAPTVALAAPLHVVASFTILADFARNVGGDRIALVTLVGPDGDAHAYEPSPADAVTLAKADVIIVNGLGLEGFLDRLVAASGTRATILKASEGVATIAGSADEDRADGEAHPHAVDPHAWQSVPNAKIYVRNIQAGFCAADAEGCPVYCANADAYVAALDTLDAEIRASFAAIPADRRTLITSHDAFFYLGHEYGLILLAPQGVSTEAEPSAAGMAALIGQIRDRHASALFVENVSDPRIVEQIGRETGIAVGGELFSDALSPADGPASTYLNMMRHNAETISAAILGR